jgi:DNA topoisomerase-1
MAVESFLTTTKPKITVEKQVKEKPSIAELTTVETPGRPSPANLLEDNEKPIKKRYTKKRVKSDNIKLEKNKNAILIITEKPQAAQKIANSINNSKKYSEEGINYYKGENDGKTIYVASAVGHLFGLAYKKGQKGWPIFELEWKPSFEKKSSFFTKKYYNLLKKLARKSSEFIISTDFDIEGEVIGWNVLRFICNQKNAKRMKFSTLTHDELKKAFESPMPELAWGNAYAGEARHILDWLYGINLSRALMSAIKTTGSFQILSIGRVQGPALKIIVEREKEISSFKPIPFWQVFAEVKNPNEKGKKIELKHPQDIFDEKQLKKFENIKEGIAETKKKEEKIPPPSPFDLTTLQREAYRLYKIGPSETLRFSQQLYLDGLISYPRTSSQKIPDSIEPKKILKMLGKHFDVSIATRSKPIEGTKSDPAHPSLYPTGEFEKLSGNGEKIYNLIVKRFISCFSPDAITANKRIVLTAINDDKIKFIASGLKILDKGWINVYPTIIEEIDLPDLNGKTKIEKIRFDQKETQPPKRFTPTSLITMLEKMNLGTKATRSMIVDTLFERGYLEGTCASSNLLKNILQ